MLITAILTEQQVLYKIKNIRSRSRMFCFFFPLNPNETSFIIFNVSFFLVVFHMLLLLFIC